MGHTVRINTKLWDVVVEAAGKRCTKPGKLIDLAIRRDLGLEMMTVQALDATERDADESDLSVPSVPDYEITDEMRAERAKLEEAEASGISPLVSDNLPLIRQLEHEMKIAREEGADERAEEIRVKLHKLIPSYAETT